MSTEALTPLAVWDANARRFLEFHQPIHDWVVSQGIPADDTYRVEVYLMDVPFARVFTYAEKAGKGVGWRYYDPATGEAAVNDPYDVPLSALPPDGLRLVLE